MTKQSGKSKQVHRRYRCSVFFKQSIHEWAAETRFWSDWARAFYELKRAAGMNHHTAVRAGLQVAAGRVALLAGPGGL